MQARRLQQLRAQLSNRIPILGGLVRRRAARLLAQEGSPQAVYILALALTSSTDERLQRQILTVLEQLPTSPSGVTDAVGQAWAETRHPKLSALLRQHGWVASAPPQTRVLTALYLDQDVQLCTGPAELVAPLVTACQDNDPQIAARAHAALGQLTAQEAIDSFCQLWAGSRTPLLEAIMRQAGYIASRPEPVRVLSILKNAPESERRQTLTGGGSHTVAALLKACQDPDPAIAAAVPTILAGLVTQAGREAVCEHFLENGDANARQAALASGYYPQEPARRALFFFLTAQWPAYETIDFDRRLLAAIYATARPALRRRIITAIRRAGRLDLLTIIAGRDERARLAVLDTEEAAFLVSMLAGERQWARLWRLLFELPYAASRQIVDLLAQAGWQPGGEDERRILAELIQAAAGSPVQDTPRLLQDLPPAVARARAHLTVGRINAVAFSPQGATLAIGASRRKVALWDFQSGELNDVLEGCEHSIGSVAFTQDGRVLAGERTNGSQPCRVLAWDAGGKRQPDTLWQHAGSVTVLQPLEDNRLLVAGRDSRLALLALNGSPQLLDLRQLDFWPRGACLAPSSRSIALLHHGVTLVSLPDMKLLTWRSTSSVQRSASFSPDSSAIIAGYHNGRVAIFSGPQLQEQRRDLLHYNGRVEGVAALAARRSLITASSTGQVDFIVWPEQRRLGAVHNPNGLTSLHVASSGEFMVTADAHSSLRLWDLRVLDVPQLFNRPFARSTPNHLAAVQALLENEQLTPALQQALTFVHCILRHRFRYDVEVSDLLAIRRGEYEIEIE